MSGLIFHLIPHTHWDREWYLPRAAFQARLVPTLDDLLDRLHTDPGYRSFLLDGQTVLVADYLRARPERKGDIQALVKTGRLQVGPWYVLADELIPSGEALVRNLLLGAADAEQLGGRLDVLYSPDAFGHPAAWPTLAREFGIRCGVVWRGLGGEPGQERDLYRWRGPDGRDVLVWHLPPAGYEVGAALPAAADRLAGAWAAIRPVLVERATAKHIPVFIGADHHAAHPAVSRLRDLLAELEPRSAFRVSRLDEFLQLVGEGVNPTPLQGELRWSYRYAWTLQGVHGTRAPLKRRAGAAAVVDVTLFRHDVLVGPPSGRVPRQGQGYRPFGLAGPDGRPIALQLLDRRPGQERLDAARHYPDQDEVDWVRVALRLPALPGLGLKCARLTAGATRPDRAAEGAVVKGRSLVNRWIETALEPTGALALHDRRTGERFFDVLRLEDGGDAGDTYSYCPPARDRIVRAQRPIRVRRLAAGPLVAALEATVEMRAGRSVTQQRHVNTVTEHRPGQVTVRLVVMLYADSPVVRCILDIDNQATWHRLRARVPTQVAGVPAVAGAPFGSVARPPVVMRAADYPLETPVATAPAQRFVAVADGRRGLALLAPGFFEYEWTRRGDLVLTLLRCVGELSRGH